MAGLTLIDPGGPVGGGIFWHDQAVDRADADRRWTRIAADVAATTGRRLNLRQGIWGGRPDCPAHRTHPLDAVLDGSGTAVWRCPLGQVIAKVGDLRRSAGNRQG